VNLAGLDGVVGKPARLVGTDQGDDAAALIRSSYRCALN